MWPIAARNFSSTLWTATAALLSAVLLLSGCGAEPALLAPDLSAQEKLAYLMNDGSESRLMLTTVEGGTGQSFFQWPESSDRFSAPHDGRYFTIKRPDASGDDESRRFSFSNDGRYLAVSPKKTEGPVRPVIIATDGSFKWALPEGSGRPAFSPDSSRVAYLKDLAGDRGMVVMDLTSGAERELVRGKALADPTWTDDRTLVYPQIDDGLLFRLDAGSGEKMQLTPPGRRFSFYPPAVSFPSEKIALLEMKEVKNIWSLDVKSGRIYQITNNSRVAGDKRKAMYLPGTNEILFQEPQGPEPQISTDLCLIRDDGSEFSMLTTDFYFDGLYSVSLTSGKIAWQHAEEAETSIWAGRAGASGNTRVAASERAWLGDPNFAPVPDWRELNPFDMTVSLESPDEPGMIMISNPSGQYQEAVLRLFPGPNLRLLPAADSESLLRQTEAGMDLMLRLEPGASRQIELAARVAAASGSVQDATLLITLAVPGTPPLMFWRDLGQG